MQPAYETYILYGVLFVCLLLGVLLSVGKRLGCSKNFPPPKDKKNDRSIWR